MPDTPFRVVFSGNTIPGHDRDTAIRNFAQLLKRTPEQVAGAFSGKSSVLKKGLSEAEAEKYCRVLEKAGLMVHAEKDAASVAMKAAAEAPVEKAAQQAPVKTASGLTLSLQDDNAPIVAAPKPPEAPPVAAPKISASLALVDDDEHKKDEQPAATGGKPAVGMTCPACGHQQAKADVCESCHVVIAKFLQRKAEKDKLEAERAAKAAAAAPSEDTGNDEPKPSLLGKLFGKLKRD